MQSKFIALFILINSFTILFSQDYTKIEVSVGPEDFVLDTFNLNERLIISCDERRDKKQTVEGDIWSYDFKSLQVKKLIRTNEPNGFIFNPHGIHLINEHDSSYLFVVNHFNKNSEIIRYLVIKDTLIYQERFHYSSSINSVCAWNKNTFFITNDRKLNGTIVSYKDGKYKTLDKCIKYPNGINIKEDKLLVSTTISNKIYLYQINSDFTLSKAKEINTVKGADNIRLYNNWLLTTSHYKFMKFIKHYKNPKKISPSVVYALNLLTGEKQELFNDDGSIISAASGAIYYKGNLYIAQVFENFILKVKADL